MNHNKYIIGALCAVLVIMAVGYAIFSTTLNIGGTANITSTWNVGFDTTKISGAGVLTPTTGIAGGTAPTGAITYGNAQNATLTANFIQPGDKMLFTLTVKNTGTLKALLSTPTLTLTGGTVSGQTATKGNIKFTVALAASKLAASTGTTTLNVTAEFINNTLSSSTTESATLTVSLNANQDTSA